jgi:hypothetical protein
LTSPNELPPTVVAMVCELRRTYPRWGAQRIAHGLTLRGVDAPPSRSSVYRILVRHGLVAAQQQNRKRKYRRRQRDAPMQLWQIDIMGGVFLADGRECKLVTGIDDHARFVVMATVVAEPGARAVCAAFTAAMAAYGVPSEVLTDNGKQFTGRFTKPYPAEVLFERICPALRGARPNSEPLPPPAPPHRAMRRVAANGTVTVAGQRLRVGRSYQGETVAIAIEDHVFRVFVDGPAAIAPSRRGDKGRPNPSRMS